MAIIINNKFVLDSIPKQIGFKFPLNGNAVFNTTTDVRDQLNANIINFLRTEKSERVFNTRFGAGLRQYVFEAITDQNFESLKNYLKSSINRNFPNLQVLKIDLFKSNTQDNSIMIELFYNIINFGNNSVKVILQ